MANCDHIPSSPAVRPPDQSATRDDFDQALSQARVITDIIGQLADGAMGGTATPCASLYAWLAEELDARLKRIEVADQTMRRARA